MESWLKALKVFVVVAGIVIVVGTATLVWLLVQRRQAGEAEARAASPALAEPWRLALPPTTRIAQIHLDGSRALLLLTDADEQQYLLLVNLATGERLSLVRAEPEPR
jgi:hypothetical protein